MIIFIFLLLLFLCGVQFLSVVILKAILDRREFNRLLEDMQDANLTKKEINTLLHNHWKYKLK